MGRAERGGGNNKTKEKGVRLGREDERGGQKKSHGVAPR